MFDHMRSLRSKFLLGLALAVSGLLSTLVGGASSAGQTSGLIAFGRGDGIYLMRPDGTGIRPLSRKDDAAVAFDLAWSRDGSKLAFANGHGNALWIIDAATRHLSRITVHAGQVASPTWSPDGRRIAFTALLDGTRDVWVMNADGSHQHRLLRTASAWEEDVAWSPKGRWLVFSRYIGNVANLYLMRTDGSRQHNITPGALGTMEPSWSPGGRTITFAGADDRSAPMTEIYRVNVDGTDLVQLTHTGDAEHQPQFSPDGKRIVFTRTTLGWRTNVYVMKADGSRVKLLAAGWDAAWRPVPTGEHS